MPEGDTLYRTAAGLRPWLVGRRVTAARARVPGPRVERIVGAQVTAVDVYRRVPAHPDGATLTALEATIAAGRIQVVTVTSAEIAAGLIAMATPALRSAFDRVQWLVPGARVAAAVRDHGVTAPILQADSALDQDLVSAIVRWRESVSGA